jgi:hypothetical protein
VIVAKVTFRTWAQIAFKEGIASVTDMSGQSRCEVSLQGSAADVLTCLERRAGDLISVELGAGADIEAEALCGLLSAAEAAEGDVIEIADERAAPIDVKPDRIVQVMEFDDAFDMAAVEVRL